MNTKSVVVAIEIPDDCLVFDAISDGFRYNILSYRPSLDAFIPSARTFRLHLGELSANELRVARAAYRFALASA
jgi:hypothetical protein